MAIAEAVGNGVSLNAAAKAFGIASWSARRWVKLGQGEKVDGRKPKAVHRAFAKMIDKAKAKAESDAILRIRECAHPTETTTTKTTVTTDKNGNTVTETVVTETKQHPGHWQAMAWWLERTYPDRYGRRDRHEHTGRDGGDIPIQTQIKVAYGEPWDAIIGRRNGRNPTPSADAPSNGNGRASGAK